MNERLKEQISELRLYSLGIVTENKPEGSDYILVTPIEKINIQEPGYINEVERTYQSTLKDVDDKENKAEIKATNKIRAKWLPFSDSNRMTAPDVVAGETVILFKFGDVEEYFWTTIFREPKLRRLENVVYSYSNIKNGLTPFDLKTSYWMQVDTKNKKVQLHTANNDGEYTSYDISIDTKNGNLTITDNKGETIHIDAQNKKIDITANKEINLNVPTVNINASKVNIKGDLNVGGHLTTNRGSSLYGSNIIPDYRHI
jgi:phage baseplate assembly protein gpV